MRLTVAQNQAILHCMCQQFGADATVILFGSRQRLINIARGNDVDLRVARDTATSLHRWVRGTMVRGQTATKRCLVSQQARPERATLFNSRNKTSEAPRKFQNFTCIA